jgi:hypothetical protein
MTVLTQDEQKRQKIMARMQEHLVPVLEHCRGGVGRPLSARFPKL